MPRLKEKRCLFDFGVLRRDRDSKGRYQSFLLGRRPLEKMNRNTVLCEWQDFMSQQTNAVAAASAPTASFVSPQSKRMLRKAAEQGTKRSKQNMVVTVVSSRPRKCFQPQLCLVVFCSTETPKAIRVSFGIRGNWYRFYIRQINDCLTVLRTSSMTHQSRTNHHFTVSKIVGRIQVNLVLIKAST